MKPWLWQAGILNRWNLDSTPSARQYLWYLPFCPELFPQCPYKCSEASLIPHSQPLTHIPASNFPLNPHALQTVVPSFPSLHNRHLKSSLILQPIAIWLLLLETILKTTLERIDHIHRVWGLGYGHISGPPSRLLQKPTLLKPQV